MKQAALSLLLITSSLFGVKEEQDPDFTFRTGKLVIKNDTLRLLAIYINMETEKPSYKQLKFGESTTFETDECDKRITLELMLHGNKRKIVLKGQALKDNHASILHISFLYAGSQ